MVQYTTTIQQFQEQGEKTGWTYIELPADLAQQLKPGNKKSFRIKGYFDDYAFAGLAAIPMGGGSFIIAINATIRKNIYKGKGAMLSVKIEEDKSERTLPAELLECLADEPAADAAFKKLPMSHQHYWANWIMSAKTAPTRDKRIAITIRAMLTGMDFGAAQRSLRDDKKDLGA